MSSLQILQAIEMDGTIADDAFDLGMACSLKFRITVADLVPVGS
jgi:hypothetical protein